MESKLKNLIVILIPLILAFIVEIFYNISIGYIKFVPINTLLFSTFAIFIGWGILIAVTRKTSIATIFIEIFLFVLLVVNKLKLIYMQEPLVISDISFFNNTGELAGMLSSTLATVIVRCIPEFLLLLCVMFLVGLFAVKNAKWVEIKRCIIIGVVSVCSIFFIIPQSSISEYIYSNILFSDVSKDYRLQTTTFGFYWKYGFFPGLYKSALNEMFEVPEGYNENNVLKMLNNVSIDNSNELGQPNIIVMFSESFWDIDNLTDVKFDKEVASNLKKLSNEGKLINMISPTYGGASENVAFELLTGGSMRYFNEGYVPITHLYKKEKSKNMPSIVKILNENNYKTEIIFGKDYYDSEQQFKNVGFEKYTEVEVTSEDMIKGFFVSDECLTDMVIEKLENKNDNEKVFLMVETIQNHMTYVKDKYKEYDISIKESNLEEWENETLISYAQGVYDADKQLGRLYEYIKQYEEPTVLIFLGDHLPYWHTKKGTDLSRNLEYFNTEDELKNYYRKYNTQAIVLSNCNIDFSRIPNYLGNEFLLTYIINNMDIEIPQYYKWLYSTMNDFPSGNRYISQDIKGNLYYTNKISGKMKEAYDNKSFVQYNLFIKQILE